MRKKKAERLRCAECAAECPPVLEVYPYKSHKRSCLMAEGFRVEIDGKAARIYERLFEEPRTCDRLAFPSHNPHPMVSRWHGADKPEILAAIREELSR
jgi:hypothetical protein